METRATSRACAALGAAAGVVGAALVVAGLTGLPRGADWTAWPAWLPWLLVAIAVCALSAAWALDRRAHRERHDTPESFLAGDDEQRVVDAIRAFETRTSGEIRVHIAYDCAGDPLEAAGRLFRQSGMTRTRRRNGVLFFVAVHERRLAVVGDTGIDAVTDDTFWDELVRVVEAAFRDGDHVGGLLRGIALAGETLAGHFPRDSDDINELPDGLTRS